MSADRKTVLIVPPLQLHPDARAMLDAEVELIDGADLDADGVAAALARAHGLVGAVSGDQIRAAPHLEVIGIPGSGWDMVDVDTATAAGVLVVNAAGAQHAAVAEHGVGLMLSLAKRIAYSDRIFHAERRFVGREPFMGDEWPGWAHELSGSTVGIVGFGFIGRDLARKCRLGFDMTVLTYDPFFDPDEAQRMGVRPMSSLAELLPQCDYVTLHVPLTDATRHLVGEAELRAKIGRAHV